MAADSTADIGEVIKGRYEVMESLGQGTYFQAFKARDRVQNRMVALKMLRPEWIAKPHIPARLVSEGVAAIELVHPNIARVYEASQTLSGAFLATEYVRGMTLKERIRRTGPLPLPLAVDIGSAIAEALEFAHSQGIVHGDLRSQNVIVTADEGHVKVTDFGVSASLGTSDPEGAPPLRSVPYMAPEVAEGRSPTPSSDIYALGVVLYEMATGVLPFEGETSLAIALKLAKDPPVPPSRVNSQIPPALDGVILKCLQKDPSRRYRSTEAMLKDLRAVQDALRFGRPLNWTPDSKSRPADHDEYEIVEEAPPASVVAISTLNKVLAFVVLIGVGVVGFLAWNLLFKGNPDIRVPDLTGMARESAMQKAQELGLVPHENEDWSKTVPVDHVVRIFPHPGMAVKPGSDLSLWISKGEEMAHVPDITQMKSQRAVDALKSAGLKIGAVSQEYNDNYDKGIIVSQTPQAGNSVSPGSKVDVVKSLGKEPDQTSSTPSEPPQTPAEVKPPNDTGDNGNAETPSEGSPSDTGTDNAPPDTTTGDATPPADQTAATPSTDDGRRRRFTVDVDVPPGNPHQKIEIEVTDVTGTHIRYTGNHRPGTAIHRIVSAKGGNVLLRVYSDGNVIYQERRQ